MGLTQNQNLTLDFIKTDITYWEATAPSSSVNSTIIVLGVLTFALQLCLALLFILRCWRLERRVQEVLKRPHSANKLSELPYFYPAGYKQNTYLFNNNSPDAVVHTKASAVENYNHPTEFALSPPVPWDLVQ